MFAWEFCVSEFWLHLKQASQPCEVSKNFFPPPLCFSPCLCIRLYFWIQCISIISSPPLWLQLYPPGSHDASCQAIILLLDKQLLTYFMSPITENLNLSTWWKNRLLSPALHLTANVFLHFWSGCFANKNECALIFPVCALPPDAFARPLREPPAADGHQDDLPSHVPLQPVHPRTGDHPDPRLAQPGLPHPRINTLANSSFVVAQFQLLNVWAGKVEGG